ncbi:DUF7344 domain-containing protein [Halobellus rubicundus]|uniref:DUF7344 domain-containing protein n=1 Tax=Halobellus rubicundus TaxID=2996466 RepID=A0ABD5MDM1_9EURY
MSAGEAKAGATSDGLAASEIHDVLRNDRRRLVLERLRTGEGEETVSDLSEHIGEIESGESPPPRNVRQSVYVSLHQTHLPKLDDLGIVDYDPDAKTVVLADNAADVGVYMEVVPQYGISWAEYYLGLGLLGLLALAASAVGVPLFHQLPPSVIALLLSGCLVASAVYQLLKQESSLLHRLRGE